MPTKTEEPSSSCCYHYDRLKKEANDVLEQEPEMERLFKQTIMAPNVQSFEDAVAQTLFHRLLISGPNNIHHCNITTNGNSRNNNSSNDACPMDPAAFLLLIQQCMRSQLIEHGSTISEAIRRDAMAVVERDPAMDTLLEVVLFAKGYSALVSHRVAQRLWHVNRKFSALFVQSQASAVFGVDIHPLARIGKGVMMDHGTGIVVGETATIGEGCTILHGVTLGGTGKEHGDRHPKVGNHVLIGAGSLLLGNITIGDSAKIGAGSVLLRNIPPFATAVGVPAKIIGRAVEADPGEEVDNDLHNVSLLRGHPSSVTMFTASSTRTSDVPSITETSSIGSISNNSETTSSAKEHPRSVDDTLEGEIDGSEHKEEEIEDEEEQKIHHHKHRQKYKSKSEHDVFCPYREYAEVAVKAPKGTINFLMLREVLVSAGIPNCAVGACFFQLDHSERGYISMKTFVEEGPKVICETCGVSIEKARQLVEKASALALPEAKEHGGLNMPKRRMAS